MYNRPYFIPGYYSGMAAPSMATRSMMAPSMMRGAMGMGGALRGAGAAANTSRGLGLFSRLGNSLSAIRGLNWGGFINNASKTLGVINQTIPLVRQVGPIFNNVKSMMRVASIFKDETDQGQVKKRHTSNNINSNTTNTGYNSSNNSFVNNRNPSARNNSTNFKSDNEASGSDSYNTSNVNDHSPTFFISS